MYSKTHMSCSELNFLTAAHAGAPWRPSPEDVQQVCHAQEHCNLSVVDAMFVILSTVQADFVSGDRIACTATSGSLFKSCHINASEYMLQL